MLELLFSPEKMGGKGCQKDKGAEQIWREGWEHGLTLCVLVLCRKNSP